jgi:hypothetical protein
MCTSLIETLHFLFVIVVLPVIFVDNAITCLANYGRLCSSESEHLYFSLWIHVLLTLILLYFPLDDFIMFSSTFIWNMHFQNWIFVLLSTWFIFIYLHCLQDGDMKLSSLTFWFLVECNR